MIFLFIYMTLNLFKEISLQIFFFFIMYGLHSQTTVHKLLLTSEELPSLCQLHLMEQSPQTYACVHIFYILCMCVHIHIYVHNLCMHVYTPAHTCRFTDKCTSALLSSHDQQPICELGFFLFLNKRQICLWPHCALYRIYIQLQKGRVSDELLKPGRRHVSPCLKAQPMPFWSHRGVSP